MGIVYDTASVALMHALAAAREVAGGEVRKRGLAGRGATLRPLRVYASDQAHSGVEKAMIVLGLGEENVVRVPSDERFRMDVQALERAIAEDNVARACVRWPSLRRSERRRRRASIRCAEIARRVRARTTCGCTSTQRTAARSRCCRSGAR